MTACICRPRDPEGWYREDCSVHGREAECGTCNGSGIAPDHSPEPDDEQPCPECCADLFDLAHRATDWYRSNLTGCCGGCGDRECHDGTPCQQNSNGYCMTCPTRRETGEVRA